MVYPPTLTDIPEFEALELNEVDATTGTEEPPATEEAPATTVTVEDAITACLQNFFAKRRASGDARPCGPHDMGPVYKAVFGITAEELESEKFLGRLRRAGLGEPKERAAVNDEARSKHKKKGGKKGIS